MIFTLATSGGILPTVDAGSPSRVARSSTIGRRSRTTALPFCVIAFESPLAMLMNC